MSQLSEDIKHKRIGDIRQFFEKKQKKTPELIKYQKKDSQVKDSDDDSITLNLNVSDDDTFCCPLPPGGKMKPTKQLLSDISKAVGEVVGIDHPVDKAPSFQTNTPLSEGAASLMGDWNMDEQVLISDENPHALDNLVCIEVHDEGQEGDQAPYSGKFAILGDLPEGIGKLDTPLAPLPQRVQKNKPTTDSPTTGTKRALPFTTTPVKDTKGKKAAKQSASQPSSPTRAGRTSHPLFLHSILPCMQFLCSFL